MASASLGVSLVAKTTAFTKGINKALGTVGRFAKGVAAAGVRVAAFGAAAATAAAAGVALMVRQNLATLDTLAKTADKLGITTEALSGLGHAAELTGLSTKTMSLGLQRMVRRVSEAATGTGTAAGALKELGLDAVHLASLSPDRQFQAIADAMEKVGGQSNKVRLAFKLFDTEGVALVNTLRGGGQAVRDMMAEAERLGTTFSRVELGGVEQANDAILRLKAGLSAAAKVLTVKLAPTIAGLAERAAEFVVAMDLRSKVLKGVEVLTLGISRIVDLWDGAKVATELFRAAVLQTVADITGGMAKLPLLLDSVRSSLEATSAGFQQGAIEAATKAEELRAGMEDRRKGIVNFFKSLETQAQTTSKATQDAAAKSERMGQVFSAFTAIGKGFEKVKTKAAELGEDIKKKVGGGLKKFAKDVAANAPSLETAGRFAELDLARVSLGGPKGERRQEVSDTEGHKILANIERNTRTGGAVTTR